MLMKTLGHMVTVAALLAIGCSDSSVMRSVSRISTPSNSTNTQAGTANQPVLCGRHQAPNSETGACDCVPPFSYGTDGVCVVIEPPSSPPAPSTPPVADQPPPPSTPPVADQPPAPSTPPVDQPPAQCASGYHRNASGDCVQNPVCGIHEQYDALKETCLCVLSYKRDEQSGACVPNEVEQCFQEGHVPVCLMAPGNPHVICPNHHGAEKGQRPAGSFILSRGGTCP